VALARKQRRKATPGGRAKLWNLPRGWAHQSFFYLDRTQRIGRVVLEIVPSVVLAWLIGRIGGLPLTRIGPWAAGLFITHTLNWVCNGNWWAGMLFTFPHLRNRGEQATCDYVNQMASRMNQAASISGVLIFGSVARGQWHDRSDLDIRLLRRPGWWHAMTAVAVLSRERWIALWRRQPLDIYLADGLRFLRKMRADEPPVFLKKDDPRLDLAYPQGREVRIEALRGDRPPRRETGESV